jgi:hypothetical protein
MTDGRRFMNDVVKPWDDLNTLLAQRFALDPDLSAVTTAAHALAVALKHQEDVVARAQHRSVKAVRRSIDAASIENRLMSDVADCWKHGSLGRPERNNSLNVEAVFEHAPTRGFRFLRNVISIQHNNLGEHDFINASLSAIRYWITTYGLRTSWTGTIAEGPLEFYPTAFLLYDPRYSISMISTRVTFMTRTDSNTLVPTAPPRVRVEIFDPSSAPSQTDPESSPSPYRH